MEMVMQLLLLCLLGSLKANFYDIHCMTLEFHMTVSCPSVSSQLFSSDQLQIEIVRAVLYTLYIANRSTPGPLPNNNSNKSKNCQPKLLLGREIT